jgi:uncharacterized protein YegP (UPF0339 family)
MYFEIYYQQGRGLINPQAWRWRLKAGNHEIMASGEGYATRENCERAIERLKQDVAGAFVTLVNS